MICILGLDSINSVTRNAILGNRFLFNLISDNTPNLSLFNLELLNRVTVTKKQNNFQITPSYFSNFFCCSNIYFCEFLSCFNFMIFFFWVKMNYFYTGSWSISATSTSKYSGRGSGIFWNWVIKENQNEISKNFYLEKKCIHFVSVIVVCFHIFYYAKKKNFW